MAQRKNRFSAIPLQSFDTSGLTSTYQALNGSTGLPESCAYIRIINNSDTDVTISLDGNTDHDIVPADFIVDLPLQANSVPSGHYGMIEKGKIFYVKGTAGTGNIYLAGYYQEVA